MAGAPLDPSPDLHPGNRSLTRGMLVAMVVSCYFSIAAMHILMGLAFLSWVSSSLPATRGPMRAPLVLPMVGYALISLLSAVMVWDAVSVKEAFSSTMPFLVYLMTRDAMAGPRYLNRSARYVIGGALAAAGLGLAQVWTEDVGTGISGSLSGYVTYSGVLALGLMVLLARALYTRSVGQRVLLGLGALVLLGALELGALESASGSGVWPGLALGLTALICLWRPRALIALPFLLAAAYALAPATVRQHMRSPLGISDPSGTQLFEGWREGIRMTWDHPLLGVGPKRTRQAHSANRIPAGEEAHGTPPGQFHNNLVQISAERGLIGLAFWLAIWIAWFVRVVGLYRRLDREDHDSRAVVAGSLGAMTTFQVMGLFEFNAGDSEVAFLTLFVFALPLAVEAALARTSGEEAAAAAD